jgi:hypothetical protein
VHRPPIVRKDVEDTQYNDQECGGPLGFETNGNHGTCTHANKGNNDTNNAPLSLQNESKEKEDKQDTSSEQETR